MILGILNYLGAWLFLPILLFFIYIIQNIFFKLEDLKKDYNKDIDGYKNLFFIFFIIILAIYYFFVIKN